jgi:hypothetical protein
VRSLARFLWQSPVRVLAVVLVTAAGAIALVTTMTSGPRQTASQPASRPASRPSPKPSPPTTTPTRVLGQQISGQGTSSGSCTSADPQPPGFVITGCADGLFPGGATPVQLTIWNPNRFPLGVARLSVAAGDADKAAAGCTASQVTSPGFAAADPAGYLVVPAADDAGPGTMSLTVAVTLDRAAPNACQGAAWPLTYSGTAFVDAANAP